MSVDATNPFVGRSEMAARMRAFDWSRTSIGPVDTWPQSLRSALSICTGSALPIAIYWGPDLVLLYNDAWSSIPGTRHPSALGRPAADVWPEIWTLIAPRFDVVHRTGEPTCIEDALLPMHRHGYTEECYFNDTFTGIRGEGGLVEGVFNAVIETTYRVVSERRTRLLQRLGEATGRARTSLEACTAAADVLATGGADATFCLVYLAEAGRPDATLVAAAGVEVGSALAPERIALTGAAAAAWPLAEVGDGTHVLHVVDLERRFGVRPPGGPWPEATHEALLAPLATGQGTGQSGVLIIGASPRRQVDEEYRQFAARAASLLSIARGARERAERLAREQAARREAELQKTHLESLFMQAPVAIAVLRGRSHVVELANAWACDIWRRTHAEVIGRPLFVALPELLNGHWKVLLDDVYESGRPHIGSEVPAHFRSAGDLQSAPTYLNFGYTPLRTADGDVDGVLVIATDVTSQVLAREEMSRLREAAEGASRAKDEFLAMLGHELRNPLAPIRTALDLLRLRGVDAALRERQIIERQVAYLVALVDDLLDVSRITRGKLELRRTVVETSAVIARGIEMSSPLLEQHHHELAVEVPREGLPLYGDLERLAQVVANLLTNAAKYTEPGGHIRVAARGQGDEIVLSVRDSGLGIDAEMLATIFDLFVQERQSLARSHGGLGLGLTIVRSLVELHGGQVIATSAGRGQGAEFVVTLPRASSAAMAATAAHVPATGVQAASGVRVLVVDDNVDAADLLAELLSEAGYESTAVHDGPSALAIADVLPPHVALLDIGLPVMDGYELARRFSDHPRLRDVRLIAVTGYGQETDRARSVASGFVAHLVKPIDVDGLIGLLAAVAPDVVATGTNREP